MKRHLELIITADKRSREFEDFTNFLEREQPDLQLQKNTEEDNGIPALLIPPNIRFEALPTEKWETVFIDLLRGNESAFKKNETIEPLNSPAHLKLYVSPSCPFCPKVISDLLPLVYKQPLIHLTIIDGEMFPEKASIDQVKAAPTLILDDSVRWTGTVNITEVLSIIRDRDPSSLGADSLRTLIENGAAEELARMMAGSGKIFPAFLDLLTHEKWPLRLGAMVAFEYLMEQNQDLGDDMIELLWRRFDKLDDSVKGDMLHLFGQSKAEKTIGFLKTILKGSYSEIIIEAAEEALEAVLSRATG
jgi:hypothetical protein